MLEKRILRPLGLDEGSFEKHAVIVSDSNSNAAQGRSASMASASGQPQISSMHQRFAGRDLDGAPVFFHEVKTVPHLLFSSMVVGLS